MRTLRLLLCAGLLAVILLLGAWMGTVVPELTWWRAKKPRYNTAALLRKVQGLAQLVTVKYVLEKVVVLEDPPQSLLGEMFAGENRVLLVAHGVVKAGVNLDQLKPGDLQVRQKTLRIVLPPPVITDAYLDDSQTEVVEHKTGLLRHLDKDLEENARQMAVDDLRRAARRGGILPEADRRARLELTGLFRQLGFLHVEFSAR
jgi:Protein of unknown function (DUF4230)